MQTTVILENPGEVGKLTAGAISRIVQKFFESSENLKLCEDSKSDDKEESA